MDGFLAYCKAVADWWYTLIPGFVLSIVDIIERSRGKEIPIQPRWVFRAFVCGLVFAQFLAYRDASNSAESSMTRLRTDNTHLTDENNRLKNDRVPHLVAVLDESILGDAPQFHAAQAFLAITIKNVGVMPSLAQFVSAGVWIGNQRIEVDQLGIPNLLNLYGDNKKVLLQFHKQEAIYEKTVSPVPSGGQAVGWLRLIVPNYTEKQLRVQEARWELHFIDVTGTDFGINQPVLAGISRKPFVHAITTLGTEQPLKVGTIEEAERLSKSRSKDVPKDNH
jgi:hypothetical protein